MKRCLALLLTAACSTAGAVNYSFPSNKPAGCSNGGRGTYNCGPLTLAYGDTIAISGARPATINISGDFNTNNAVINAAGNTSDLNIIVSGALILGYQAQIKANITAASVNDAGGGNVVITGNLTASGGNISLAYQTSVSGNVATSGTGTITTPQSGTIGGSVSAGTGSITISEAGSAGGDVTSTGGSITVVQSATVAGNVSAGAGAVSLGYQSKVNGNLGTTGTITMGQSSRVGGAITGGAGNVTVGYAATVVGTLTTSSGTISFDQNAVASACVKSTGSASITLGYQSSINSLCCGGICSLSCVVNNSGYAMPPACAGSAPAIAGFTIAGTGAASTCTPQVLTLTAKDSSGSTLTSYRGTVSLSTSTGLGTWSAGSGPAPSGTLLAPANNGQASYTFAAADAGIVKLLLAHSLAQTLTVTVVDAGVPTSSSTSATISYANNAFVWAEDIGNKIAGSNIVVAGRPHDMQISLVKKDPTTGICGVATDFNGTRSLKLWRTDNGGPWAAPSVSIGASNYSVPASRPTSNNLSLAFASGVASGLNLVTSDVGKYTLNLNDDSQTYASSTISGSLGDLTVRPFTIAVSGLTLAGTSNPGGSAATDAVFGKAGAAFSANVGAYLWSSSADIGSGGTPDAGASLAQVTAGGLAPGFNASVGLTPLAGAQTPGGGVLGALSNGVINGFSGGIANPNTLSYSEVGSFLLNTSAVVGNYLGTAGLALDATVFGSNGAQNNRIGRFVPAGFAVSNASTTHRSNLACSPASTFTYLGENFQLGFMLTAQNTVGSITRNYTGSFAKLDLTTPTNLGLGGISGTTMFKAGARLSTPASSGNWSAGVATVSLTAQVARASSPDGPFDTAQFGIAPQDSDGTSMASLNLDTDSPANGVDRALLGTVPLRQGRLRLLNGMSAANRTLTLPLAAEYWDSTLGAFTTNTLDSCTAIAAANLSFGNYRKTLDNGDTALVTSPVTLAKGLGALTLKAPASGHQGSMDIAIALGVGAPPADASCLKTASGWTPAIAASLGANLAGLRGAWCGGSSDPSARATWGLYRGSNGIVFQRENY